MIYLTGDTHAEFNRLSNKQCPVKAGDYLIITGDFGGVWDHSREDRYWLKWLSEKPYTILFLDGNHENFDLLSTYPEEEWHGGRVHRLADNLFHLMRGQIFEIDGYRFFVMGGAASHDTRGGILNLDDPDYETKRKRLRREGIGFRVNHVSWWADELPTRAEMEEGIANLARAENHVDVILTHCAPTKIQSLIADESYPPNALTDYLEILRTTCTYDLWIFGHYHRELIIGNKHFILYESIVPLDLLISEASAVH